MDIRDTRDIITAFVRPSWPGQFDERRPEAQASAPLLIAPSLTGGPAGPSSAASPDLLADERRRRVPRRRATGGAIALTAPNPGDEPGRDPRRDGGLLARLLGQHVSPELLALWLVEVVFCALLFYALLAGASPVADTGHAAALRINQALALALTFGMTSVAVGLYSPDTYLKTRGLLVNTAVGGLLAFPAVWLVGRAVGLDIAGLSGGNLAVALKALLGWTLFLFGVRLAFSYALRANLFVRRVLIVGSDAGAARLATAIASVRRGFFEVGSVLPPDEIATLEPRRLRADKVWGVIVTAAAGEMLPARDILRATERGLRLYSDTEFWERQLRRIDVDQPHPHWDGLDRTAAAVAPTQDAGAEGAAPVETRGGAARRRAFDVVLGVALLALTLPLMLLTALVVKCDSRGPVLYRQERVGLHGRSFTLCKFRSMRTDAEARGPVWAAQRDPRVTRVGAFIRLTRIDELPQLVNVLRGEMSFIGPRPERPHFVAQLEQVLPFYRDRMLAKPGLTGWAQVNYPYGASVEDARAKLSYDLYYVKHRSLSLDLLILLSTVRVVLFQRGAR